MLARTLLFSTALVAAFGHAACAESLKFLGATTIPYDAEVDGTPVGGLSGLDFNPDLGQWAIISDDKSDKAPARFYWARIDLSAGAPKVTPEHAVTLQQADGKPYPNSKDPSVQKGGEVPDPESIRFDPAGKGLWWTSEGDRKHGHSPFVREAAMNGEYLTKLEVPSIFAMHKDQDLGPRDNNAFEGLSFTPDGKGLWLAMESALYQDGKAAAVDAGTIARFTKFDRDGKVLGQYAYPLDPIQAKTAGPGSDNGVSEILALDDNRLLVIERSGINEGFPLWTLHIRIYEASVADADDIAGKDSLAGETYRPLGKRLILNLDTLPELGSAALPRIDNIEGVSFGPKLANGHRSLVLISDNNFNPLQVTQILAFEVMP